MSCPAGYEVCDAENNLLNTVDTTITCQDGTFAPTFQCCAGTPTTTAEPAAEPAAEPEHIPAMPATCANYIDFQAAIDVVSSVCCEQGGADCSVTGFPATCPEGACPHVIHRLAGTCATFLSAPLNHGIQQIVARADDICTPPLPCTDYNDFQAFVDMVNNQCCDTDNGTADCSTGMPATCDWQCSIEIRRFDESCADLLSQPINKAIRQAVTAAAATCDLAAPAAGGH